MSTHDLLDKYRASLKSSHTYKGNESANRRELFDEARKIAVEMKEYSIQPRYVSYLKASRLEVSVDKGIDGNPYNLNMAKIPISIIEKVIEQARAQLDAYIDSVDEVINIYPTEVAEICFDGEMSKGAILKKIRERKEAELKGICEQRIRTLLDVHYEVDLPKIDTTIKDHSWRYYSSDEKGPFIAVNKQVIDFLKEYAIIRERIIKTLDYMFKEREEEDVLEINEDDKQIK